MKPNRDFIASDVNPVGVTNNPTTSAEFKIPPFGDFFSNEAELGNKGFTSEAMKSLFGFIRSMHK